MLEGLIAAVFMSGMACGQDPSAQKTIERALVFLEKDAELWKSERTCATCHHGALTVWTFNEAKQRGYAVKAEWLADMAAWSKERFLGEALEKPRGKERGYNTVSLAAIFLASTARAVPRQESLTSDELQRIAEYLTRYQEPDGSWERPPLWAGSPAPPVMDSHETWTLFATLALGPADPNAPPAVRDSRKKAAEWLNQTKPADTTQSTALRLLVDAQGGASPRLQPEIDRLLGRQNADGGWGQVRNLPSDAYATGQALYALSLAGMTRERREIQAAVRFLVDTQKTDGSWPMTPRAHPGKKPAKNTVPIVYFGSAWATLGLLRAMPPAREVLQEQQDPKATEGKSPGE